MSMNVEAEDVCASGRWERRLLPAGLRGHEPALLSAGAGSTLVGFSFERS